MSAISLAFKIAIVFIIICAGLCLAADENGSKWYLAKDKLQHFTLSAVTAAGIGFVAYNHFEADKNDAVFIGFAASFGLGGGKEILDSSRSNGHSSLKDLTVDLLGALAGSVLIAVLIK